MTAGDWQRAGGQPIAGNVVYEAAAKLAFRSTRQTGNGAVAISIGVYDARLSWTMAGSLLRRGLEGTVPLVAELIDQIRVSPGRGRQHDLVFVPASGGILQIEVADSTDLVSVLKAAPSMVQKDPMQAEYERIMGEANTATPASTDTGERPSTQLSYAGVTDLIGQPWLVELERGVIVRAVEVWDWDDEDLRAYLTDDNTFDPEKCRPYLDEHYDSVEDAEDALWGLRACEEGLPYPVKPPVD